MTNTSASVVTIFLLFRDNSFDGLIKNQKALSLDERGLPAFGSAIGDQGLPAFGSAIGDQGLPAFGSAIGDQGLPASGGAKGDQGPG